MLCRHKQYTVIKIKKKMFKRHDDDGRSDRYSTNTEGVVF